MKITNTEVYGIEAAVRGMRNPMNSWYLNDTKKVDTVEDFNLIESMCYEGMDMELAVIGPNDMKLAKQLISAGPEHCKFLRQIQVWVDLNLPRYIWSEFDTYKFNTKNSCSTMHKLFTKEEITLDNFYLETQYEKHCIEPVIVELNWLRNKYLETKEYGLVRTGKRILPESFLQMRTVNTNYAELMNIYHQRKNHRLKNEWGMICDWIESLPYMKEFLEVK